LSQANDTIRHKRLGLLPDLILGFLGRPVPRLNHGLLLR